MIGLATLATIIASQALITGAFSLATQAMSLGLIPYLKVRHTHDDHEGQIYVPAVNWALYIGCILLVIGFKTSSNLASAYGLAVSGVMLVTTLAMIPVATSLWKWNIVKSLAIFVPLATIDAMFLFANSLKAFQGGYVPLFIGIAVLVVMKTWLWGRQYVKKTYSMVPTMSVDELIKYKKSHDTTIPRSIFILTPEFVDHTSTQVPFLKQIFWERYGLLPKHLVFLTVAFMRQPHVDDKSRFEIHQLFASKTKGSITSVKMNFGFMEEANVEGVLKELAQHHQLNIDENMDEWLFHVAHERVYAYSLNNLVKKWQFNFFQLILKNSETADEYLGLGKNHKLTIQTIPVHIRT
jgi:KUP system potassium uptake protein